MVADASSTSVTPVPPRVGLALDDVSAYNTPRLVIEAPPSLVTSPPSVAVVVVTPVTVGVVMVGATDEVVKVDTGLV